MGPDRKLRILAWALGGLWLFLVFRAAQVQLVQHARWDHEALLTQSRRQAISAHRGEIRTADGDVLASRVHRESSGASTASRAHQLLLQGLRSELVDADVGPTGNQ